MELFVSGREDSVSISTQSSERMDTKVHILGTSANS